MSKPPRFVRPLLLSLGLLLLGTAAVKAPASVLEASLTSLRLLAGGHLEPVPPVEGQLAAVGHEHCEGGLAGPFPCRNVDLQSFLPREAIGASEVQTLNDIWGWADGTTGREYALVGLSDGTSFVDITDSEHPRFLGKLPTRTVATTWRDIKTYRDHAYIVADNAGGHGMQVFDLRQLRGAGSTPQTFRPTAEYFGPGFGASQGLQLGSAHNLAINEETGFAYVVGSNNCLGGLHMVNLADPARPRFAGCFSADGYTHDVQCVVYRGPDSEHQGQEICFASNEDTLTIVDVSDKSNPRQISRTPYSGVAYAHQAWVTEDHAYLLSDDELDEIRFGHHTRTLAWNIADLEAPRVIGVYEGESTATDHNLYIRGGLAYQANYASGLRILQLDDISRGELEEVAFFDVQPESDAPGFTGAWSVYPFFPSGTAVVSGIQQGLYVLRPYPEARGAVGAEAELLAPRHLRLAVQRAGIVVAWRDTAAGSADFRVYRSLEGGPMELVASLPAGRLRFADGQAQAPGAYTYRVTALRDGVESRPAEASIVLEGAEPGQREAPDPGRRPPRRGLDGG